MLVWLIRSFGSGAAHVSQTGRIALAGLCAFLICLLLGPLMIGWLQRRFRERIASDSLRLNELHAHKQSTPTMGGLFVAASIVLASLFCADLRHPYPLMALGIVVTFGGLGAWDDWIKLSSSRNGMTARQKFVIQTVLGLGFASALYLIHRHQPDGLQLAVPITGWRWPLGLGFVAWVTLVLVGSSNGVNLTDGLDGLASGCLIFSGLAYTALTYLCGHSELSKYLGIPHLEGCGELSVVLGAMVGALLGFLWFNCYPAQVFMGDAGSLPLGALLGFGAVAARQELLLVVAGGVFVIETLSVIAQVGWFRTTGRRLIACSPLHNHFLFRGHHEIKIVTRFWIVAALLALVALGSLKLP